jgi:hypothetical protein
MMSLLRWINQSEIGAGDQPQDRQSADAVVSAERTGDPASALSERTPRWPWRSMYGPLLQQDRPYRLWWILLMLTGAISGAQVGSIFFDGQTFLHPITDTKGGDRSVEFRLQGREAIVDFLLSPGSER